MKKTNGKIIKMDTDYKRSCFFRHRWGRWEEFVFGNELNAIQRKYCLRCNKMKQRFV